MLILYIAIAAAMIGVVYAHVLPDDPSPLSQWWFPMLSRWAEAPDKWWKHPRQWIAYPLGYCAKCTSGHIALWFYLFTQGFERHVLPYAITSAALAILSAPAIIKYYTWATK